MKVKTSSEQKKELAVNNQSENEVIYRDKFIPVPVVKKEDKPTMVTQVGNFTASLVKGQWIYKANDALPLIKKKVPTLKFKDPVQYKIMEEYEVATEQFYKSQLKTMVLEIAHFLLTI